MSQTTRDLPGRYLAQLIVALTICAGCSNSGDTTKESATPTATAPAFAARAGKLEKTPIRARPTPAEPSDEPAVAPAGRGLHSSDAVSVRIECEPDTGGAPLSVRCAADGDTDVPGLRFRWDFGDGSLPASGIEVEHVFWQPGEYTVALSAERRGVVADSDEALIIVEEQGFDIEIEADPDIGIAPLTTRFRAVLDDVPGPLRFLWEFGDGSRDFSNPTSHTYRTPGTYSVRLTVINGQSQWAQADVEIQVDDATSR